MLTRRSFLIRSATVGAAVAAPWVVRKAHAAGSARSFTYGYDEPHETGYGYMADTFDHKLQELSGGTFKIRQFPDAALGQEPEMAQKVRTGDIDFASITSANTATVVPQSGVFSLHYIFRDDAHLERCLNDPGINATFKKMIAENTTGARSLGLSTLALRNMYSKFPISNVRDIRGKKFRVQATKTEDAFITTYHAIPVHMPFGQVYTSLQTGLVDIAENGNDIYLKNKHYEVAPVLSKTEHEAANFHLWVSDKVWNSLTDEQRQWVQGAADYARPLATRKSLEYAAEAVSALKGLGVTFHEQVDKNSFETLAAPLQMKVAEDLGKYAVQLLTMVRKLA